MHAFNFDLDIASMSSFAIHTHVSSNVSGDCLLDHRSELHWIKDPVALFGSRIQPHARLLRLCKSKGRCKKSFLEKSINDCLGRLNSFRTVKKHQLTELGKVGSDVLIVACDLHLDIRVLRLENQVQFFCLAHVGSLAMNNGKKLQTNHINLALTITPTECRLEQEPT